MPPSSCCTTSGPVRSDRGQPPRLRGDECLLVCPSDCDARQPDVVLQRGRPSRRPRSNGIRGLVRHDGPAIEDEGGNGSRRRARKPRSPMRRTSIGRDRRAHRRHRTTLVPTGQWTSDLRRDPRGDARRTRSRSGCAMLRTGTPSTSVDFTGDDDPATVHLGAEVDGRSSASAAGFAPSRQRRHGPGTAAGDGGASTSSKDSGWGRRSSPRASVAHVRRRCRGVGQRTRHSALPFYDAAASRSRVTASSPATRPPPSCDPHAVLRQKRRRANGSVRRDRRLDTIDVTPAEHPRQTLVRRRAQHGFGQRRLAHRPAGRSTASPDGSAPISRNRMASRRTRSRARGRHGAPPPPATVATADRRLGSIRRAVH